MNNSIDSIDGLFDDQIAKVLKQLGYSFPKSEADFKKIESDLKMNGTIQPEALKNPYTFLGKRSFKCQITSTSGDDQIFYDQNLSQAARAGKDISEEIRRKMAEDKLKASQKKSEN
jgi:hypothetical protein